MSASPMDRKAPSSMRQTLIPLIAYSFIFTLLFLMVNLLPLYTGILIDVGGMSPADAGGVSSTYLGTMAVAAIGATFLVSRITPRTLAYAATVLQAAGFVIPLLSSNGGAIFLGMAIAGLGNGALFAVANASGALEKHPVLIFGAGMVLSNLVPAAIPTPLYAAVDAFGLKGLFITPLVIIPVILISLLVLPKKAVTDAASPDVLLQAESGPNKATAGLLLTGIFLYGLFATVFYAYTDRLLVRAGFDTDAISIIFTAVFLMAAVSGVIAMATARWPKHLAMILVVVTVLVVVFVVTTTVIALPAGVVIFLNLAGMSIMLGFAIQPAVAAQIDPTGRLSAAASGAMISSMAIGPILGGWLIEAFGFTAITVQAVVLGALSIVVLGLVYARHRIQPEAPLPTTPDSDGSRIAAG